MLGYLSLTGTFILGGLVCILYYLLKSSTHKKDFPGPKGLPIFGNLFDIDSKNVTNSLRNFRQKYGDIYKIRLGKLPTVVISGYDNIREVFLKRGDEFSCRPDTFLNADILKRSGKNFAQIQDA